MRYIQLVMGAIRLIYTTSDECLYTQFSIRYNVGEREILWRSVTVRLRTTIGACTLWNFYSVLGRYDAFKLFVKHVRYRRTFLLNLWMTSKRLVGLILCMSENKIL